MLKTNDDDISGVKNKKNNNNNSNSKSSHNMGVNTMLFAEFKQD